MNIFKSKKSRLLMGTVLSLAMLPVFTSGAQAKTAPKCKTITPITMFFHFRDRMAYDESLPVMKYVEQHTCTKIISKAPKYASKSLDVLNLHLASGHLADIIGIHDFKPIANKYGIQGTFMPLNKLIDKYAPHIKKAFDTIPGAKLKVEASDGNIYYLPQFNPPSLAAAKVYFIRKDWLDKLHLPVPKTAKELEKTLIAFRDKDPNGNGRKDEIPFCNRYWEEAVRLVTLFGGRTSGSDYYFDLYADHNKVKYAFVQPEFKAAYKHVINWYKQKLIDPQIFTRGKNSREILFSRNQCGMTHDWIASTSSYNKAMQKKVPGFKLIAMDPPVGTDGSQFEENARELVRKDGWGMSAKAKNPEAIMKFFDWFYSPEGSALNNFGLPGITFNMVNGKPIFTQKILKNPDSQKYLGQLGAVAPLGFVMDANAELQTVTPEVRQIYKQYRKFLIPQYSGVSYTVAEQRIYDKSASLASDIAHAYLQQWMLGTADIDKTWAKYMKQMKATGFLNAIKVTQTAYDRTYHIKKK